MAQVTATLLTAPREVVTRLRVQLLSSLELLTLPALLGSSALVRALVASAGASLTGSSGGGTDEDAQRSLKRRGSRGVDALLSVAALLQAIVSVAVASIGSARTGLHEYIWQRN